MNNNLYSYLVCPSCNLAEIDDSASKCNICGNKLKFSKGILRFVSGEYHSNFGLQWNKYSKVQLDSFNGSDESESRLLAQSGFKPENFRDKLVLEVGAGNGRFTELLLKYGAKVIAVDYSTAIDANFMNNSSTIDEVVFLQADLFNLPVKPNSFDIVICYGVIQHTGDNKKAIVELCKYPKKGGKLLLDIYSNGLRHFNPWIYIIRPFFSLIRVSDEKRLGIVNGFVSLLFPFQLWILKFLHNKSWLKFIRYIVNRSPNSVYGINLYLDGKINLKVARDWCILDTYDGWAPKHDHPVSKNKWKNLLKSISIDEGYSIRGIAESGQGHAAILEKE